MYAIDSLMDFIEDNTAKITKYLEPAVFGGATLEVEAGKQWCQDVWCPLLSVLENRLKGHGKNYIAGTAKPTIADFKCFYPYLVVALNADSPCPSEVVSEIKDKCTSDFPCVKQWLTRMESEQLSRYIKEVRKPTKI